ncbi:MAG: cytochrome C oxidase subunit IV family protein [candidate division WOR-3 bacterium]
MENKETGYSLYFYTWLSLIILTFLTVTLTALRIFNASIIIALTIAGIKSTLVVLYFMHLKYEDRIFKYMVLFALSSLAIILILLFSDYPFRGGV